MNVHKNMTTTGRQLDSRNKWAATRMLITLIWDDEPSVNK